MTIILKTLARSIGQRTDRIGASRLRIRKRLVEEKGFELIVKLRRGELIIIN